MQDTPVPHTFRLNKAPRTLPERLCCFYFDVIFAIRG
jgi:hypothetical protein